MNSKKEYKTYKDYRADLISHEKELLKVRLIANGLLVDFKKWFKFIFPLATGEKIMQGNEVNESLLNHINIVAKGIKDKAEYDQMAETERNKRLRVCINACPASGKTTILKFYTLWLWLRNPKSKTLITSINQQLLSEYKESLQALLNSPIIKHCYGYIGNKEISVLKDGCVDFDNPSSWKTIEDDKDYNFAFSTARIKNVHGGLIVMKPIKAHITGLRAGISGAGFKTSGALIIDDPETPNISANEREKIREIYKTTLKTRLELDASPPVIVCQQRLAIDDFSDYIVNECGFHSIKEPLVDESGHIRIPHFRDESKFKEACKDNFIFQSQYQQRPVTRGGNIIKLSYFGEYEDITEFSIKKTFITVDTAQTDKTYSDYTVFTLFGVSQEAKLYVMDVVKAKYDSLISLKKRLLSFISEHMQKSIKKAEITLSCIYIENKSNGIDLINDLNKTGFAVPVIKLNRGGRGGNGIIATDKNIYNRFDEVREIIESGKVLLNKNAHYIKDIKNEIEEFTYDYKHKHDDFISTLLDGCFLYKTMYVNSLLNYNAYVF
jgi:predicted phage terminase large subunit-like protein